jgi:hypothetical protein
MWVIQGSHRKVRDMRSYLHSILMDSPREYEDALEERSRALGVPKEILDVRLPLSESERHFRNYLKNVLASAKPKERGDIMNFNISLWREMQKDYTQSKATRAKAIEIKVKKISPVKRKITDPRQLRAIFVKMKKQGYLPKR